MIGTTLRAQYVYLDDPGQSVITREWDLWTHGMSLAMLHYQNSVGLNPHVRVLSVATDLEN